MTGECGVCGGRDLGTTDGPDGQQWPVVCGACTPSPRPPDGARRACISKRPYRSRREARQDTRKMAGFRRPYRCWLCGLFHITSSRKRSRK